MELELSGGRTVQVSTTEVYLNNAKGFTAIPMGSIETVHVDRRRRPRLTITATNKVLKIDGEPTETDALVAIADAVLREHRALLDLMGIEQEGPAFPQPLEFARRTGFDAGYLKAGAEAAETIATAHAEIETLRQRLDSRDSEHAADLEQIRARWKQRVANAENANQREITVLKGEVADAKERETKLLAAQANLRTSQQEAHDKALSAERADRQNMEKTLRAQISKLELKAVKEVESVRAGWKARFDKAMAGHDKETESLRDRQTKLENAQAKEVADLRLRWKQRLATAEASHEKQLVEIHASREEALNLLQLSHEESTQNIRIKLDELTERNEELEALHQADTQSIEELTRTIEDEKRSILDLEHRVDRAIEHLTVEQDTNRLLRDENHRLESELETTRRNLDGAKNQEIRLKAVTETLAETNNDLDAARRTIESLEQRLEVALGRQARRELRRAGRARPNKVVAESRLPPPVAEPIVMAAEDLDDESTDDGLVLAPVDEPADDDPEPEEPETEWDDDAGAEHDEPEPAEPAEPAQVVIQVDDEPRELEIERGTVAKKGDSRYLVIDH